MREEACAPDFHECAQDRLHRLVITGNNVVNNVQFLVQTDHFTLIFPEVE